MQEFAVVRVLWFVYVLFCCVLIFVCYMFVFMLRACSVSLFRVLMLCACPIVVWYACFVWVCSSACFVSLFSVVYFVCSYSVVGFVCLYRVLVLCGWFVCLYSRFTQIGSLTRHVSHDLIT